MQFVKYRASVAQNTESDFAANKNKFWKQMRRPKKELPIKVNEIK